MAASVHPQSLNSIGHIGDCQHNNSSNNAGTGNGQIGGIPDLENIANHQHVQPGHSALTPPPQMPSSPWTISDTNNHCLRLSEKLRVQREQARFADLILSVQGREFPAHRCVLAACSTWFDSKLKVHKCTREHIEIDQCKDYEIFYALLTYCYTGHIVLNDANVPELLHLSNFFGMVKLKSYCCEYLGRHLSVKTVHSVLDQALKYQISDLTKQSLSFIQRHFAYLLHHQRPELMSYSYNTVQCFLLEKAWSLPQELVLKFVVTWVNADLPSREDFLIQLLEVINWNTINTAYIADHIDCESLYNSPTALYTILHVLERNGIYLGPKFQEIYQNLQAAQELDELNDSNSFLTLAINSAVKTLEHSEVDPDWFLQGEGHPLPEQMLTSSGTSIVMPQASTLSQRQERLERYKDSFDLDIFEQVMNEQQLTDERQKFAASTSAAKRYDPKYRALTEAIRLMEEEEEEDCEMPPPPNSPKMSGGNNYPPHPKQRHLSNSLAFVTASSQASSRNEMGVRSDGQSVEFLPAVQPTHRVDIGVRNDGLAAEYLSSSQPSQRLELGVRTDSISTDFVPTSQPPQRIDLGVRSSNSNLSSDFIPTSQPSHRVGISARTETLSSDFIPASRVRGDGLSGSDYLPNSHRGDVEVRNDGLPNEYLPNSQALVHDVPFEAMVDYDTLDSPDFIVPDVPTPPAAEVELESESKFFAQRNFDSLESSGNGCQQPQTSQEQEHQSYRSEMTESDNKDCDDLVYAVEGKKQKASKLQRLSSLREASDSQQGKASEVTTQVVTQNRHVKKAKLLAEHRRNAETSAVGIKVSQHEKPKVRAKKPQLSCSLCSYTTRLKSRLVVHERNHANAGPSSPSLCPFCDFRTSFRAELLSHVRKTHRGPPYICPICNHSTKKLYRLLTHSQVHSSDNKFVCSVDGCDFATNTAYRLKFHTNSKHRGESFQCLECVKSFSTKQTLRTHQLVHLSDQLSKSFRCDVDDCSFTTKYASHLTLHKKIHRGEVFRCTQDPACNYVTPKLVHLKNHEKVHKGEKNFACDVCQKKFIEKSHLTRHAKVHSDDMPFSCARCKFKTKRKDKLKNHILKIHKESS